LKEKIKANYQKKEECAGDVSTQIGVQIPPPAPPCQNWFSLKTAKLIKLVGMLLQTKAYLFWSKQHILRQNASLSTI